MTKNKNNSSLEMAKAIAIAMEEKKGEGIKILDLRKIRTSVTDFFVVCSAQSKTQVNALADSVEEIVFKLGNEWPYKVEGRENSEWILLDYVDAVAHVFQDDAREFYKLEDLWADADTIEYR